MDSVNDVQPNNAPYNQVFESFVDDNDDLEGLVAYALYKQHKRSFILRCREDRQRDPTDDETRAFVSGVLAEPDLYVREASSALLAFARDIVESERPEIEEAAIRSSLGALSLDLKTEMQTTRDSVKRSTGFLQTLGLNVAAFFLTAVVLIGLAEFTERAGIDIIDIFSSNDRTGID